VKTFSYIMSLISMITMMILAINGNVDYAILNGILAVWWKVVIHENA